MRVQNHTFDNQALSFGLKLVIVLVLLLCTAHFGTQALVARLYPRHIDTTEVEQQLAVIRSARLSEEIARVSGISIANAQTESELISPRKIENAYIDAHIPGEGKFVGVDLVKMVVLLYEDGELVESYPVVSKGVPGSPWETPTGQYKITTKTTDHFSTIGKVHMPYSMHFFGNFFIHGWPYYPDGTLVDEGYSGGCVRMSSADAQKIFRFVDVGTPIYIYDTNDMIAGVKDPLAVKSVQAPNVSAIAYIVADLETGDVLLEKNSERRRPIASVTKLMTAIVANETIAYNREVPLPYKGQKYYVNDLLYPLMLRSDNSVANALAAYFGDDNFISWMNQKAKALQMNSTKFEDPSGLSYNNVSTAGDLFRMARYLYDKKEFILAISKEKEKSIESVTGREWEMTNQNRYAGDAMFVGGKLGFTDEAKKTGLSVFAVPFGDEIRSVAVVVLGSNDWKYDSDRLLAWVQKAAEPAHDSANAGAVGAAQEGWQKIKSIFQ